jgi:ribosomal protein S18 acetylase RimI-like enzyme
MLRKVIASNESYELVHDTSEKTVSLIRKNDACECLKAKFFHDTSDGASLLSDFRYQSEDLKQEGLAKLATDMVSDYLSRVQNTSKLFCCPDNCHYEFADSKDYRSSQIDRLMVRETNTSVGETKYPSNEIKIDQLDAKSSSESDVAQMMTLLKQTYWAKDEDESYLNKALENSVFLVARNQQDQIIGLVRYITNGHFAYISDMVVDKEWRKQHIATALTQQLCQLIDERYAFTALISAKEGDGKDAAPKLYGEKFGFKEYDQSHLNKIYFRYIRMAPNNAIQNVSIAGAANSGLLLMSRFTTKATVEPQQPTNSNRKTL